MVMKLEVGKTYVNGRGNKVKILHICIKLERLYPYLGVVQETDNEYTIYYNQDGNQAGEEDSDLVKEYVTPTYRWFPMYRQGCGRYSDTLEEAILDKTKFVNVHGTVCFVGLYRVDLETGDITKIKE